MSPQTPCESTAHSPRGIRSLLPEWEDVSPSEYSPIPRRAASGHTPLSIAQERLWLMNQLQPGSHLIHQFGACLHGELDLGSLEQALSTLLRRHEILRTNIHDGPEGPRQVVTRAASVRLPVIDLTDWPAGQREGVACRLAANEGAQPFDLRHEPLIRTKLLRLSENDYRLVITAHKIVIDASSEALLVEELLQLYRGVMTPELPVQYADFAEWQRKRAGGRLFSRELSYWKSHLEGAPALLELPADRLRPAVKSYRGGRIPFRINARLAEKLRATGRREDCTLFMTLLAALQTLVHRYTGSEDIVIGTPVANRNRQEVEGLIGCFANTLALRTKAPGDLTFRELLARVRRTVRGALAHQELPFEKLVENLELPHDPSFAPLFQVLFDFDGAAPIPQGGPELKCAPFEVRTGSTEFDLTLHLRENEEGLEGWVEYATDLFDGQTIERLIGHYETLLAGVVTDPHQRLSHLPLLTEVEHAWQRNHFDHTAVMLPPGPCVHELIREQAGIRPDAVAVECGAERLTFGELEHRSDQLARILSTLEIGSNDLVAICVDPSVGMAVAVLGILKAGGACLPLDPDAPETRLAGILREARPHALLTLQGATRNLSFRGRDTGDSSTGLTMPVIYLDAEVWEGIKCEKPRRPWSCAGPENLACVIYTQDPESRIKGVEIPHRALSNLVDSLQDRLRISEQDTLLAANEISSGSAILELLLPLASGATTVIASNKALSSSLQLRQLCEQVRPTIMQAPPAIWRALIEAGWQGHSTLKILCGGGSCSEDLAEQLLVRCGSLWNLYGTTEATVWSAASLVEPGEPAAIREPIVNTSFHILDSHQQPVPIGIPGELYIGGDGVALGYLRQPELTAYFFVADPFRPNSKVRLFRTGDRVRYTPQGEIEFLGRMSFQPRVRGFQVEPCAIEAVLRRHPAVAQTVVAVREDPSAERRLVAYIVPAKGCLATSAELEQFLRNALPEYMVPSAIVLLGAIPMRSLAQRDREALPAPERLRPVEFTEPRTELETTIREIWREVLGTACVGLHDDFFELGGHSLEIVRMHQRLRDTLGRELPILSLFQNSTVSRLSDFLERENSALGAAVAGGGRRGAGRHRCHTRR